MSRFYAEIRGNAQTEATRCGTERSGIWGHIRGWDVGIEVNGHVVEDKDTFHIYATGGSHGSTREVFLGTVTREEDQLIFTPGE